MRQITTSRLTPHDAPEAYGLARLAFDGLTPGRWRAIVRRWTRREDGPFGALVGRDRAGRLVGFAPFAVRDSLTEGRVLWVEGMVGFSLLDPKPVLSALAEGLSGVADALGCRGFEVAVKQQDRLLRMTLDARQGRQDAALIHCPV
ncbi:MAG: hypothetical protein GC145_13400 [Caulobacter sp.]|nr:hypothetical protein [Caulobacter sp.]